jgi:uncharacterized SAM-binding protein YcdF (DUF218 family)
MKIPPPSATPRASARFLGLLVRKERWGLSFRGWLAALLALLCAAVLILLKVQPFLAVTNRVDANYLVMEGWVHQFAAKTAAAEFSAGNYQKLFITGVPVIGSGEYVSDSDTEAYVGAGLLKRAGVKEEFLQRVPRRKLDRDRTYGSALELKKWLLEHHLTIRSINVVTESAHARRTWRLFSEALGPDVKVGIIAAPNPDYEARHWWRYSEGVREVLGESLAYFYAVFIFRPDPD